MPDLTEVQLREAIRELAGRVPPITLEEIIERSPGLESSVTFLPLDQSEAGSDGDSTPPSPPKRWLIAACAAAVIAVALVVLVNGDAGRRIDAIDNAPVTTSTTRVSVDEPNVGSDSATDTVMRFAAAMEDGDVDAARALVGSPSSHIRFALWGATLEEQFEAWEAAGVDVALERCDSMSEPGHVDCFFLLDDKISRAQGLDSVEVRGTFQVIDGAVDLAALDLNVVGPWVLDVWAPFAEWAEVNRPTEFGQVYPNGFEHSPVVTGPEVMALYIRLIDDYVQAAS